MVLEEAVIMFSHQSRQQHLICMPEISISECTRTENNFFFLQSAIFLLTPLCLLKVNVRSLTEQKRKMYRISGSKPEWVRASLGRFVMWTIVRSCSLEEVKPLDDVTFRRCVGVVQRARGVCKTAK